jgi:hypothetical protein
MTPFVLRPFFIRSVLATGLIVGATFALLEHRKLRSAISECVNAPQSLPSDPVQSIADDEIDRDDGDVALAEDTDHDDDANIYFVVVETASADCEYYSSFTRDTVELAPGTKLAMYKRNFKFEDGCTWQSEEKLERTDDNVDFYYTYREHVISCPRGHHPADACTRSGVAIARPDDD